MMIKYICKLSNTDLFCKNGYQTVDLWNSTMFKSTFWTKRKQQLLTIPHFSWMKPWIYSTYR